MENNLHIAYISLGSNIGDRIYYIHSSINLFKSNPKIKIEKISSIYETEPLLPNKNRQSSIANCQSNWYLNAVVNIETKLSAIDLLSFLQQIENKLGRTREIKWGDRTIDLDILLYDDIIMNEPNLTIPHPQMHNRNFVLIPLCEIAKDIIHPLLMKSIFQLKNESKDKLGITKTDLKLNIE